MYLFLLHYINEKKHQTFKSGYLWEAGLWETHFYLNIPLYCLFFIFFNKQQILFTADFSADSYEKGTIKINESR